MSDTSDKKYKFIPYLFIIFFAVIFAVDFTYIYIAKKSWRGVYTKNAYQKGLQYNQILKQREQQKELGWLMKFNFEQLPENIILVTVNLIDKEGRSIKGAKLNAKILRPIQEGLDFTQDFKEINNSYQAKIKFPLLGQWEVQFKAKKGDNIIEKTKRYVVS
jgi:nitrogen fixation protein FixH